MIRFWILFPLGIFFIAAGVALGADSAMKGMGAATFWAAVTTLAGVGMVVSELTRKKTS
jgi:hypothetical protein